MACHMIREIQKCQKEINRYSDLILKIGLTQQHQKLYKN